jgi:hypothetical protein
MSETVDEKTKRIASLKTKIRTNNEIMENIKSGNYAFSGDDPSEMNTDILTKLQQQNVVFEQEIRKLTEEIQAEQPK